MSAIGSEAVSSLTGTPRAASSSSASDLESEREQPTPSAAAASTATPRKTITISADEKEKKSLQVPASTPSSMYASILTPSHRVPAWLRPRIAQLGAFIKVLIGIVETILPFIERVCYTTEQFWKQRVEPYSPELLFPSVVGFVMCFFGGSFLTLIAAVEAYRMIGFDGTWQAIKDIYADLKQLREMNKKDDEEDLDNDGIHDVDEVNAAQLAERKMLLILRTVDPVRLERAVMAINAGFLAVVATLKVQFAKAITLGHAIASAVEVPVHDYLTPHIEALTPVDYRKWVKPVLRYVINAAAISIAWTIQRVISAYHSAIRGGTMFARNIFVYLCIKKYININHEESYLDEVLAFIVGSAGLYFQLSTGFALPFPLNILLFPCSLAEWFLMWTVNQS